MLILALAVSGCAAYFSVWGLSQLFAGASTAVIIMASVLEIGKIVTTTALHRYWDKISSALRVYLTISVAVLMLITSAGIYGFLSNAYQQTANKLEIHEGEISVLEGKKLLFEKTIRGDSTIIANKNKRIELLTNLRHNQENRIDSAKSTKERDKNRLDIDKASNEIQKLTNEIDVLNSKNAILTDSVGKYNTKELELKAGSSVAAEVGPLKYISELTGTPMGKVVNYLILLLIFVFDPLAIALILMTNRVFELQGETNPLEPEHGEGVNEGVNEGVKIIHDDAVNDAVNDGVNDAVNDAVNDGVEEPIFQDEQYKDEYEDDSEPTIDEVKSIQEPVVESITAPVLEEPVIEPVINEVKSIQEPVVEPIVEEVKPIEEPKTIQANGKIEYNDIKEIKEINRGFSVPVPQPKRPNMIERIGSNKMMDGDNNKVIFKRR